MKLAVLEKSTFIFRGQFQKGRRMAARGEYVDTVPSITSLQRAEAEQERHTWL